MKAPAPALDSSTSYPMMTTRGKKNQKPRSKSNCTHLCLAPWPTFRPSLRRAHTLPPSRSVATANYSFVVD